MPKVFYYLAAKIFRQNLAKYFGQGKYPKYLAAKIFRQNLAKYAVLIFLLYSEIFLKNLKILNPSQLYS